MRWDELLKQVERVMGKEFAQKLEDAHDESVDAASRAAVFYYDYYGA